MPRNPPADPRAFASPTQFENFIHQRLSAHKHPITRYTVLHNQHITRPDGTYQIDITASFRVMGADFKVLIECKHMNRALPRDEVMAFHAKLQALGAQKGIIYCTGGFQKGAIAYAELHGLALVKVVGKHLIYEVKSSTPLPYTRALWQLSCHGATTQCDGL